MMDRIGNCFRAISDFFDSPFFNPSFMTKAHFIQIILVVIMISLTGARIAVKPSFMPVTRSDTLGIVMVSWASMISCTYKREVADSVMIGYQNSGGSILSTHDDSHYQVQTLAKSLGLPDSEYHGNPLLVCGCYNHFHGNFEVLSERILRSELVGCPDRHHFDVCVALFCYGQISPLSSSYGTQNSEIKAHIHQGCWRFGLL